MAGADRVEGTLFGNGERTGNVDIINAGDEPVRQRRRPRARHHRHRRACAASPSTATACRCPPRHPYVGDLVYTSFSGQPPGRDQEGLRGARPADYERWGVPYLPIDPKHVGRTYEAVIRVNSQSGKGGVAYVMKAEHGFDLPRRMQIEFSKTIQHITEDSGTEITPVVMWEAFQAEYLPDRAAVRARRPRAAHPGRTGDDHRAGARRRRAPHRAPARAAGRSRRSSSGLRERVRRSRSTSSTTPSTPSARAPRPRRRPTSRRSRRRRRSGEPRWGIGIDPDITTAGLKAVLGALERQQR